MRAAAFLLAMTFASPASAQVFEGGLQVGVIDRQLGNTPFRSAMNGQLYADVNVLPKLLAVGAYWNGYPAGDRVVPDRLGTADVNVTTLGVRAKLFGPRIFQMRLYASVGIGRATADFPETRRDDRVAPKLTTHFAEVPLSLGFSVPLEGPFMFSAEGSYRLALGYDNAPYDRLLHGEASRSGRAWTLLFGLAIAL